MKIALINGSPRAKGSASGCILNMLKSLLPGESEIIEHHFRTPRIQSDALEQIANCSALVLAFPLYVDGVPSHLLNCLYNMESFIKAKGSEKMKVYALVNCGFFEGHQSSIAMEIIKNWCQKSGLDWGGGVGIGGGGMIPMLSGVPDGKGLKKNLSRALKDIAGIINAGAATDNTYISPNIPRLAYRLGAEMGWRKAVKENGLRVRDLGLRR